MQSGQNRKTTEDGHLLGGVEAIKKGRVKKSRVMRMKIQGQI